MLGLFLLLPVLALHARELPDYTPVLLGLAMGAYGLTQALLQIPFGRWSDRFGRKPVIAVGLALFAAGSLIGAVAQSVAMLIVARSVQGAGAVSAAVSALLADLTRPEVRTRAMAVIGASIGLSFVLALVLAPVLDAVDRRARHLRRHAAAWRSAACVLLGVRGAGRAGAQRREPIRARSPRCCELLASPDAGAAVRGRVRAALHHDGHVPVRAAGAGERPRHRGRGALEGLPRRVRRLARGHGPARSSQPSAPGARRRCSWRRSAWWLPHRRCSAWTTATCGWCSAALTLFFAGFNYLEARLPAQLTLAAPGHERGAALGIFATAQFLGAFLGGALGGVLLGRFGLSGVFWGSARHRARLGAWSRRPPAGVRRKLAAEHSLISHCAPGPPGAVRSTHPLRG